MNQLMERKCREPKQDKCRYQILRAAPHKSAICRYIRTVTPKKPCSANRLITKTYVRSLKKTAFANIKGEYTKKNRPLMPHNVVLLRGGRRKDTPGCKYSVVFSFDDYVSALKGLTRRNHARSKYAVRNIERQKRTRLMNNISRRGQN